ncbi:hypothetical protein [Brevibacillus daliensis]|uniref:hypothetical protein n=1 Tax=Brevibacillus daliensis TaxID=2892995 RepID=UPI001E5A8313|nr:hypothetical protein [Brevibacillus daliensis]
MPTVHDEEIRYELTDKELFFLAEMVKQRKIAGFADPLRGYLVVLKMLEQLRKVSLPINRTEESSRKECSCQKCLPLPSFQLNQPSQNDSRKDLVKPRITNIELVIQEEKTSSNIQISMFDILEQSFTIDVSKNREERIKIQKTGQLVFELF